MKNRLKAWLPNPQTIKDNRWLRWMGPALHHPRLWHFSRKGIALGLALGIFFGLLVPVAQIPLAAGAAVALRANLPMAVASTLVTNPVTFGPVYFGAYHLGKAVLGEAPVSEEQATALLDKATKEPPPDLDWHQRVKRSVRYLTTVGKPLVVGLAIIATAAGLLVYFLINAVWTLRVRWLRSRRLRSRL
jgi:uncharacterized protein